eukprot:TRINITY_DN82944_c0_g1_i1.p1 TRINITY_DN82944_c0_g1~~TRINITY_DN82944_c0_g1_i1.p1  ORF type:complete len:396 (+),score=81.62 TRINITY_DN82944_c0_g1_i1:95-1282(+)
MKAQWNVLEDGASEGGIPEEALVHALSFLLGTDSSLRSISAVSRGFRRVADDPMAWNSSVVCISTGDLKENSARRPAFQDLLSKWEFCEEVSLDFSNAHVGKRRHAAERCFVWLAQSCQAVSRLCLRNWYNTEKGALGILSFSFFPQLRHLELSGGDQISSYEAMIPVFRQHPSLLSLRATFSPKAEAGASFANAAPKSLMALGFVRFDSPESLTTLLDRCMLQHLWLASTSRLSASMARAFSDSPGAAELLTLALPSPTSEEQCQAVVRCCPKVSLLCRMRVGSEAFGSTALAQDWELLPAGQGVVLRRRGSLAELAENGSLWTPFRAFTRVDVHDNAAHENMTLKVEPASRQPGRKELAISASSVGLRERHSIAALVASAAQRRHDVLDGYPQ